MIFMICETVSSISQIRTYQNNPISPDFPPSFLGLLNGRYNNVGKWLTSRLLTAIDRYGKHKRYRKNSSSVLKGSSMLFIGWISLFHRGVRRLRVRRLERNRNVVRRRGDGAPCKVNRAMKCRLSSSLSNNACYIKYNPARNIFPVVVARCLSELQECDVTLL